VFFPHDLVLRLGGFLKRLLGSFAVSVGDVVWGISVHVDLVTRRTLELRVDVPNHVAEIKSVYAQRTDD
jgi:hypothetical protein